MIMNMSKLGLKSNFYYAIKIQDSIELIKNRFVPIYKDKEYLYFYKTPELLNYLKGGEKFAETDN